MTKLMILGGVAAFVLLTVGILTSLPARADNNANSQLYPNGRYALVEGEVDLAQLQQGGRNSEQMTAASTRPGSSRSRRRSDRLAASMRGEFREAGSFPAFFLSGNV